MLKHINKYLKKNKEFFKLEEFLIFFAQHQNTCQQNIVNIITNVI